MPAFIENDPPFHDELCCFVAGITYDFRDQSGLVIMGENSCTDMRGCIALFKRIDPEVRYIATQAGEKLDTVYRRSGDRWFASERFARRHQPEPTPAVHSP